MPYLGERNGDLVTPLDVADDEVVDCPACGGHLGIRDGHYNRGKFIARHFFHKTGGCAGESDIHRRMKTIACFKLQQVFPFATIENEHPIGDRFADAVATFPDPIKPFGDGLVVEVQHKHSEKDIGRVSQEYLDHGYSVFWAYQSDFDTDDMEFAPHRARTVWPDALPDRDGVEGYPEVTRQFRRGEFRDTTTRRVPFPDAYWQTHVLELCSPVQGHVQHDWELLDDIWLHSTGRRIAWFTIYRSPDGDTYVELWGKDKQTTHTRHIPVRWTFQDLQPFGDALSAARRALDDAEPDPGPGTVLARTQFSGTDETRGWFALYHREQGEFGVQYGRQDRRGNGRHLDLTYREGDLGRLETLGQRLAELLA